ncbi:Serine/threonine protein kinase PrkC, regulator of stationary phase [hydrothermal vent metagenome]|uniref:Serine/threonine protein kinase PrkC, regulator of stationary phase n=1 Tax=hydrothermal vent metagenome TaxID=652676 RepID=A0A3B1C7M4_9ZZZZ
MIGKTLSGKYEIKREVGRGGMGVIYEALHTALNRTVAIKVLHAQFTHDIGFLDRFKREARAMARLDHKNIIRVFDVLEDEGTHFIIMEYFRGQNLHQVLKKRKTLSQRGVLSIAYQVSKALSYAHDKGVIHRDIKPANIIIGKNGTAKIADFGIAATTDESSLTAANHIIGTPEYMSLEQSRGEVLDGRSDLYALGMVMYEMLCGQTYYAGIAGSDVLKKLAYDESEFQLHFEHSVTSSLKKLVKDLLKKKREDRIADASVLIQQIKMSKQELKSEKKRALPKQHSETRTQETPPFFTSGKGPKKEAEQEPTVIAPKQQQTPRVQDLPATKKRPKPIAILAVITLIFTVVASTYFTNLPQTPNTRLGRKTQPKNEIRLLDKKREQQTTNLEKTPLTRLKEEQARIEKENRAQKKAALKLAKVKKEREQAIKQRKRQEALLKSELIKLSKEQTQTRKEVLALNRVQRKRKSLVKNVRTHKKKTFTKQKKSVQVAALTPANTIDSLGAILSRLTTAYEKKDLRALQKMTQMSKNRTIFLKQIFNNYKTITVSVTDLSIEANQANATISITELRTHQNKKTLPPNHWKDAELIIPKDKGHWKKVHW